MFDKKFKPGQTVRVKPKVKPYGGQTGTVDNVGVQLGYPVVSVRIEHYRHAIVFAPEELELIAKN